VDSSYRLLELLGNGAFGGVFRSEHLIDGRLMRQVAIKLILPESEELDHELGELVAATSLHHPFLVRYFHAGTTVLLRQKLVFIVMELAEKSLRDSLKIAKLPAPEVLQLAEQLAEALAFLHARHLAEPFAFEHTANGPVCVHRDVKPANVLLINGVWKLADFGLVRLLGESQSAIQTAVPVGTPQYMPPESFNGTISPAWDLWSLGALLVEACTGAPLWDARPADQLRALIKNSEPPIPGDLPSLIEEIARGCLVKDYRQRWRAAQVVEKINEHREAERQRELQSTVAARISVLSIGGSVFRVGSRYRFQIRIEADNDSNCVLGWSGLTINIPTLSSRDLYAAAEIQMSSIGCDRPFQYGPGDEILGFLDDGSFGRKQAACLLIESAREQWPPHERIVLEVVLVTSCRRLDLYLRVWSNRPPAKIGDGFGDPDWKAPLQKDQQGIPAYPLSVGLD
jgi:serine/threonine-protein kinase